jgi:zinc transport system substrate-binding protein
MLTRIILILVSLLAAVGCGAGEDGDGGAAPDRLTVAASFYPLAYAAERVGGDRVDVWNVTPPGTEPHDVELSPRDVQRIREADVVLYLGSGFQPAVEEAAEGADGRAVDLLEGIQLAEAPDEAADEHADEQPEESGEHRLDPHVWLDPRLYARIARRIARELGGEGRAAELTEELAELDRELDAALRACEQRVLVTNHAAFGYLARRYRLEQVPISGLSPEAEPSPRELEEAVENVRELGASTIFTEELVSPDVAETVARETGATTALLSPLEGLTEDQAERGEDYFSLMRANLRELREGLRCT